MKLRPAPFVSDLDTPLLRLPAGDAFTLRHAVQGVHVFGGIGSGKSSAFGKALAEAYLRAGFGGIWLVAKPEEVKHALDLAKANGRANSVILFDQTQGFNFIDYELARQGPAGISNVVECLMRVLEAADQAAGAAAAGHSVSSDPFWAQAMRMALNYTIPVLHSAYGRVTVASIVEFVTSAAVDAKSYKDEAFCQRSLAAQSLKKLATTAVVPLSRDEQSRLMRYWFHEYTAVTEKTRSNIVVSLSAKLDRFKHGRLRETFCGKTTVVPEMTFHGAIIILAMPALTWNEDGLIGQQLFKFMWQRAVESRNGLAPPHRERPVFMWGDEAQYFLSVKDDEFLSTCRGSLACPVFMSQTLPSYYARLGRDKSDAVDGLVGKFATQLFLLNADHRTNEYASHLIGRGPVWRVTRSETIGKSTGYAMNQGGSVSHGTSRNSGYSSTSGAQHSSGSTSGSGSSTTETENWGESVNRNDNESTTVGHNEQMDWMVEPNVFASALKSGGKPHGGIVTGLWFKAGAKFEVNGGRNFMVAAFRQ